MELRQLFNLTEFHLEDREDWAPVKVADADGTLWPLMSLGWSTVNQCFVLCPDWDDEGPEDGI